MTTIIQCGDEEILNVKTLKPSVQKSLKNIIDKEGFTSYKVNVKDLSTNGGNYMGSLQTVTVTGKLDNGDKELNLFLKNIVVVDEGLEFNLAEVYQREGLFYKELFHLFEQIQDKYNIPREERLNAVKGYKESNTEVIILEDISKAGYKTYDRFDAMPIRFAELAIEQLGKLHAMSFILQKEYPKYFEEKIMSLRALLVFTDQFVSLQRRIYDKAMETLDENAKAKLDKSFLKMMKKYENYIHVSKEEGVCLLHGDFRANNILVKEINGVASKVIPVDYQLINYGCPVIDFIYFIFMGTDQQFRKNHLENLKETYYHTFETFLSKFSIEAKEVYSRKQFEEDYREKLDYGLMCFMTAMPFLFAKSDEVPDFENGFENISFNLDLSYKDRLHGIVDDFIQWGYL